LLVPSHPIQNTSQIFKCDKKVVPHGECVSSCILGDGMQGETERTLIDWNNFSFIMGRQQFYLVIKMDKRIFIKKS